MTAIRVENLGKRYRLGEKKTERYDTFRNMLVSSARHSLRRLTGVEKAPPPREDFWALRNVSFEVKQGQRVGIIGRNGAGKSTLLKLLSRITEPSEGRITLRGRVGSLLEVGTGFHPELTGRENIYLNGAVLGMRREEIRKKFDEIVDFSGVEEFLDTPVKRYSSGMYVRLAFAVAAHLEPDTLIIDEVLAVGDAAFQKKCLGKMDEFGRSGRTVLFVSHNMPAVEQMCDTCLLLQGGAIEFFGDVKQASRLYLQQEASEAVTTIWQNPEGKFARPEFAPLGFSLLDGEGNPILGSMRNDEDIWVQVEGEIEKISNVLNIGYVVYGQDGQSLYRSFHTDSALEKLPQLKPGRVNFRSKLPRRLLNEGNYRVELMVLLHSQEWLIEPGQKAPVLNLAIKGGLSDSPSWRESRPGLFAPVLEWEIEQ